MSRVIVAVATLFSLAVSAPPSVAQQDPVAALRLNPGEAREVAALGLPESGEWRSVDTLVAVVSDDGVIRAREWGRTRVLSDGADGETQTVVVHVAPTGVYDFSGVLEYGARGARDRVTRSVTGSLTFSPAQGATLVESDCGDDAIMLDREGRFFLECGEVGLEFYLGRGGVILGEGGGNFSLPGTTREVCIGYDARGICVARERQPSGPVFRYLLGPLSVHKRPS